MDCLVRAFAEVTSTPVEELIDAIGHQAPHHIQEIIEELHEDWHITEFSCKDIDPDCPFDYKRLTSILHKYDGVLSYWSGDKQQHAIPWKKFISQQTNHTFSIFWRVEPRK